MSFRLAELAESLGGEVCGDGDRVVVAIRTLETAGPDDLSFLTDARYQDQAAASRAGALLVASGADVGERDGIVVADPGLALAELIDRFHPPPALRAGVHETAVIDPSTEVDPSASIGPYCVIGAATRVGARSVLSAHVVLGDECEVGDDVLIHPQVVAYARTQVGDRSIVHAGVVLGSDGFGFASSAAGHRKIRHVGGLRIGADVEIGANSALDRAVLDETTIGDGTKIDNLVQVGHNVRIGSGCLLVSQAGIAGSSTLGDGVVIAGQSGVAGHLKVGNGAMVAAKSAVFKSLEAGRKVAGVPATDLAAWRRQQARIGKLETMSRRLRSLEQRLAATEE